MSGRQQAVGDRVAQRLEARGGELGFRNGGPPGDVARVPRLGAGQQLRAGARGDSVRAFRIHQHVEGLHGAVLERHGDATIVLAEVGDLRAEVVAAFVEAAREAAIDGVPRREPVVHSLAVDLLPARVEELEPRQLDLDPGGVELARLVEVAGGHRVQSDAGSARFQRGPRTFEHVDLAAEIAQHERRGEAPDRATDDADAGHRVRGGAAHFDHSDIHFSAPSIDVGDLPPARRQRLPGRSADAVATCGQHIVRNTRAKARSISLSARRAGRSIRRS